MANWSPEGRRDAATPSGPLLSPSTVRPSDSIATAHASEEETEAEGVESFTRGHTAGKHLEPGSAPVL